MSTVIPLRRKAAYTPLDPPGSCMTPGHEDRPAGHYPGGWLCDHCIGASRRAYRGGSETERTREEHR